MRQYIRKVDSVGMSIVMALDPPFDGHADDAFQVLGWLVSELDRGTEHVLLSTLEAARRALRQLDAPLSEQTEEGA